METLDRFAFAALDSMPGWTWCEGRCPDGTTEFYMWRMESGVKVWRDRMLRTVGDEGFVMPDAWRPLR